MRDTSGSTRAGTGSLSHVNGMRPCDDAVEDEKGL